MIILILGLPGWHMSGLASYVATRASANQDLPSEPHWVLPTSSQSAGRSKQHPLIIIPTSEYRFALCSLLLSIHPSMQPDRVSHSLSCRLHTGPSRSSLWRVFLNSRPPKGTRRAGLCPSWTFCTRRDAVSCALRPAHLTRCS